ncbi:hypothetical protein [Pseudoduganella namucuonensis]|uniref:Uncharacterized protein n=1 Tax=Pseudoduganella namucuonensis TaxID=1035707 RepID=A0A1I7GHJ1_9BURK|nr:hypothetical protein [Pseudoduganella namucuonensis]SFU47781.1 hypothetical protein SAMN05216552_1003319 [Pseudoduganella namucuonensis]
MVSVTSVDTLRNAVAIAERKVQQDRTRVDQDASRLEDSRQQLSKDQEELSTRQKQTRQAESASAAPPATVRLDQAIATPVPPDILPRAPQLNAQGQTVGRLINIVA